MIAWGQGALVASAVLMLFVLIVRAPVRRWVGPQLGYLLWVLPALRLAMPELPANWFGGMAAATGDMQVLFAGPAGPVGAVSGTNTGLGSVLVALWSAGAVTVVTVHAVQHLLYCRRLAARGTLLDCIDGVRVIATDVDGPLAFGAVRRVIAVPRDFLSAYDATERDLALAHELAHHARGDLIANWASIAVLAVHWWNPLAWIAIRAFRDDQELATDAQVIAARGPAVLPAYARVLAKASGIGAARVQSQRALQLERTIEDAWTTARERPAPDGRQSGAGTCRRRGARSDSQCRCSLRPAGGDHRR